MKKWFVLLALNAAMLAACGGDDRSAPETPAAAAASPGAVTESRGVGVVQSIDVANLRVTIAHDPIESLGWPSMTMGFAVSRPELLDGVSTGQRVEFTLQARDMPAVVTSIRPAN